MKISVHVVPNEMHTHEELEQRLASIVSNGTLDHQMKAKGLMQSLLMKAKTLNLTGLST